jgi:hypothetical protein
MATITERADFSQAPRNAGARLVWEGLVVVLERMERFRDK